MPRRKSAAIHDLTPFARELQDWLATQRREDGYLGWSHAYLADRLPTSRSTVDAWFRPMGGHPAPTLPGKETFYLVRDITGWPMEKLLALTGYREPPPYEPTIWQFLLDDLRRQRQFVDDQQRIGGWLRDAQVRWSNRAKRPARRAAAEGAPATPVVTSAGHEAALRSRRRDREPVGSGK